VHKLIEGNDYIFRVSAVNKEGTSKPLDSEIITAKSPFGNEAFSHLASVQITSQIQTRFWSVLKQLQSGCNFFAFLLLLLLFQ